MMMEKMAGMLEIMLKINTTFLPGSNPIDAILDLLSQNSNKKLKEKGEAK